MPNTRCSPQSAMYRWIMVIAWSSFAATVCFADSTLGDSGKKEIVYRMYADYKKGFPKILDVSAHDAMALLSQDRVVFVDVRKPAERKVSMLPDAVTKADFLSDPSRYAGKAIVAYCTISYRSGKFARKLARKGIIMGNLKGGMLAWVHEGGKLYNPEGETRRMHVFGKKWDLAPAGYETVSFGLWGMLF